MRCRRHLQKLRFLNDNGQSDRADRGFLHGKPCPETGEPAHKALPEPNDRLAGLEIVKKRSAAARVRRERLAEECGIKRTDVRRSAGQLRCSCKQTHPTVQLGGSVVAVHHGDGFAGGRRNDVDIPVQPAEIFFRTTIAKMDVPAETLPVPLATALVAAMPVAASPSGGAIGMKNSSDKSPLYSSGLVL